MYGVLLVFQKSELQLFDFLFHERSNLEKNSKTAHCRFWPKISSPHQLTLERPEGVPVYPLTL